MTRQTWRGLSAVVILLAAVVTRAAEPGNTPTRPADTGSDFAFIHLSDIHVDAHLLRSGPPKPVNGAETIDWLCREAARPQTLGMPDAASPAPSFGIATGDVTEFGVIDDTWAVFEHAFAALPFPLYVVPGNHDNTWVASYAMLRQRYGGENYSFDKHGCHFACISSASPQEPVPTIDAKTRAWLACDLQKAGRDTPVFIALHHPPDSGEFANPAEYDTLMDFLKDYNVVLLLYGHGHSVVHKRFDDVDGVMGGSTFGDNAGYSVVSVVDGRLRVDYRYHHPPKKGENAAERAEWKALLDKPLRREMPKRLFRLAAPRPEAVVEGQKLDVALEPLVPGLDAGGFELRVDGEDAHAERAPERGDSAWRVDLSQLVPGAHLLSVRLTTADKVHDVRATTVFTGNGPVRQQWRRAFPAALKAAPVVAGERVITVRTDGAVEALERRSGTTVWTRTTGGEILSAPVWTGSALVVGSGDGKVYALDERGEIAWTFDAGLPVYGAPRLDGDTVYVGDNGGRLYALGVGTGKPRWTFSRADFSIEGRPERWGDRILFGAWDGNLYAVSRTDGALAWKTPGPKAGDGKAARYYSPADCGPVALGDTLFVCDRGYLLGTYTNDGKFGEKLAEDVAAIAADEADRYLYVRSKDNRIRKLGADGRMLWEREVPTGRFPIPPTVAGDRMYVCSDRGRLSVLKADDGSIVSAYQVTPGFFVMAAPAVDADGTCYVAGMDGSVTALRPAP